MPSTVLIVDDCASMRNVIRRILGMSGFPVEEYYFADDGDSALALLRRHHVDVILSDINMPRLDGEAMLMRLREDEALRNVPVLIVSSDGTQDRISRLMSAGAKGYIVKPFQPAQLRAELERVLGGLHA